MDIAYEGVLSVTKDGETKEYKNKITDLGLALLHQTNILALYNSNKHRYFNEGATYIKSNIIKSSTGSAYSLELGNNALTLVGMDLTGEVEPVDLRFLPIFNKKTLALDESKVTFKMNTSLVESEPLLKDAQLVAPPVVSTSGDVLMFPFKLKGVKGKTTHIGMIVGDYNTPLMCSTVATVCTPVIMRSVSSFIQMNSCMLGPVDGLLSDGEFLFGTVNDGALGRRNITTGETVLFDDGDPLYGVALPDAGTTHCCVGGVVYFVSSGQINAFNIETKRVTNVVSTYNYRYTSNLSTDGEFLYEWTTTNETFGYGTCRKLSLANLSVISSSYIDYDEIIPTVPKHLGVITNITQQNDAYYIQFKKNNVVIKCSDIHDVGGSILDIYASPYLPHMITSGGEFFFGSDVVCDYESFRLFDDGANIVTGGIKVVRAGHGGHMFNLLSNLKTAEGDDFVISGDDDVVECTYTIRVSNK